MDKIYDQTKVEQKWYQFWEDHGYFKPEVNPRGAPYTIILPPPNANAPLHFGHAMYAVEDILIRYHRMLGEASLWLPGSDHAGFETQAVFEKKLEKEGKSRFDFDRPTLYQMIWDFVQNNKGVMAGQLRRLGFSLDWSREKFTLDPDIVKIVYKTFKKMFDDGLIYRGLRIVNYCTKHATSFSDLEVLYEDRTTPLYYIKYGPLVLATVRLETKFGDSAVAVHPDDKRYQQYIGKTLDIETVLGPAKIKVVADKAVDPQFGTGVIKVTPAHSSLDFEIGERHNLEIKQVIGFDGKLNDKCGRFAGMTVKEARAAIAKEMLEKGLIEKVEENYQNRVGVCYKCGTAIEPLLMEQWFVKVAPLAKQAVEVVKNNEIKIYPKNWESTYLHWLKNLKDWNISRQIVWGVQIPAWRCMECSKLKSQNSKVKTITQNLKGNNLTIRQFDNSIWIVTDGPKPDKCPQCDSTSLEQDPDVFDTWFSSSQWPFAALMANCGCNGSGGFFDHFYPTAVMETGYDILLFWVARMIMLGIYATGKIPFKDVVLHGKVLDPMGRKMSKSKGNVVNPIEVADQYGADAIRMALVYGTAFGHDQALSHPKLQAMRNFTNKLWNIARFIIDFAPTDAKHLDPDSVIARSPTTKQSNSEIAAPRTVWYMARNDNSADKEILQKLSQTIKAVTRAIESYRFHDAAEALYEFIWHQFADKYIEASKDRRAKAQPVLEYVFKTSLELLHPFMPFITEELWQRLPHSKDSIMITNWPQSK